MGWGPASLTTNLEVHAPHSANSWMKSHAASLRCTGRTKSALEMVQKGEVIVLAEAMRAGFLIDSWAMIVAPFFFDISRLTFVALHV